MSRGGRFVRRRVDVQGVVRRVELAPHRVGEVVPGAALLGRLDEDLVVDVGDVADQRDVEAARGQPAAQHVEVHRRADVTDVRLRLHRQPAQVDPHASRLARDEVAGGARRGVVESDGHRPIVSATRSRVSHPATGRSRCAPRRTRNIVDRPSCRAEMCSEQPLSEEIMRRQPLVTTALALALAGATLIAPADAKPKRHRPPSTSPSPSGTSATATRTARSPAPPTRPGHSS